MARAWSAVLPVVVGCVTACQGNILGTAAPGGSADVGSGGTSQLAGASNGGGVTLPAGVSAGPQPLRRLSRVEYENTVRDLFALGASVDSGLPLDARGDSGFTLAGAVGEVDAERLQASAERVATSAVAQGLPGLMGCTPEGASESSCVRQFLQSFGRRAFRRPATEAELTDLEALYQQARGSLQLPVSDAITLLLSALLQAPQFLYLWERTNADDPAAQLVALNSHELASRLSYLLWRTMPDAGLLQAVDEGRLATPGDVEREARRLLGDSRAEDAMVELVRGWFRLPDRHDDALSSAASGETELFVKSVLRAGGSFESLLTSPTNFVNDVLAPLYGAPGVEGSELREQVVNAQQRFGLLTQVAFLGTNADGAQSHPVKRGAVILHQVLCAELPPVPDDVPQPEPQREGVPNRERFEAHSQNACAVGCHRLLDPLGFAFESYDGAGRWRSTDAGQLVDASGSVELPSGARFEFSDARQLVTQLGASAEARGCAAKQALRLALNRHDLAADEASLAQMLAAFAGTGYDLRELLVSVATTPSFAYRAVSR
jgi:hypothetical protein